MKVGGTCELYFCIIKDCSLLHEALYTTLLKRSSFLSFPPPYQAVPSCHAKKIVYFYLLSLGLFSRWLVLRGGLIVKSSQCDLLGRRAGIKSTASFSTALDLVYKLQMQSWIAQSPRRWTQHST
jgi:hypothetical protein